MACIVLLFEQGESVYKLFILSAALVIGLTTASFEKGIFVVPAVQAAEEGSMSQVRLVLKKLRGSMASMKDFDELESAGMDKADVNRMRSVMKRKIKQMTTDAVDLISAL